MSTELGQPYSPQPSDPCLTGLWCHIPDEGAESTPIPSLGWDNSGALQSTNISKADRGMPGAPGNPSPAATTQVLALQKQLDAANRFPAVLQPMQLCPEEQRARPATPQLHREPGCSHGTSSRLLSQHHSPSRPRVLQERRPPALCSHHPPGPKPVQAPVRRV